jgi:hypothetical protein
MIIVPLSIVTKRIKDLAKVDFPLPDSPTTARVLPFFIFKETSSSAFMIVFFLEKNP